MKTFLTIIKAFATPITTDIRYIKYFMLLGKKRMPTPEIIQRSPPAEYETFNR